MTLEIELPPELAGTALPVDVGLASLLSQADLNTLALRRPETGERAPLRSIRQSHHMLARLLADDVAVVDISAVLGYSPSHIRILQDDPSVQELVAHYRARSEMERADLHTQVQAVAQAALIELRDRLDDPEKVKEISESVLIKLMESGLDRTGHGPTSKIDVRVTDVAKIVESLRDDMLREQTGRVIPIDEAGSSDDTPLIEGSILSRDTEGRTISEEKA